MVSLRFYTAIYLALLALASSKWVFFQVFDYWDAVSATIAAALVKTTLIAGYYQHLRFEPRAVTYIAGMGVLAVFLLAVAATYSIF